MKPPAFTLVELIVVIALLGILASISAPAFLNFQRKQALLFALDQIEAELLDSYAFARSHPDKAVLTATSGATEISCDPSPCHGALTGEEKLQLQNAQLTDGFRVRFDDPYGDMILTNAAGNNDIEELIITVQNTKGDEQSLKLYRYSGLIERLP